MNKYMIITNDYPTSIELKERFLEELMDSQSFVEDVVNPDYVFVIGGDGTLLRAVNEFQDIISQVCFVPIKSGSLGFYSTFDETNYPDVITKILMDDVEIKELPLLEVSYDGDIRYGLNEVKIVDHVKTLRTNIYVNNELLEYFRGSGLVFATSTGSTGYMRAILGAVILSDVGVWEMKELAPIANVTFSTINAPIVMDYSKEVRLQGELSGKNIIIDTYQYDLHCNDVLIKLSEQTLNILYDSANDASLTSRLKDIFALNGSHE